MNINKLVGYGTLIVWLIWMFFPIMWHIGVACSLIYLVLETLKEPGEVVRMKDKIIHFSWWLFHKRVISFETHRKVVERLVGWRI